MLCLLTGDLGGRPLSLRDGGGERGAPGNRACDLFPKGMMHLSPQCGHWLSVTSITSTLCTGGEDGVGFKTNL